MPRRAALKTFAALGALNPFNPVGGMHAVRASSPGVSGGAAKRPSVAVIGAGAFGGWTALNLLRRGAHVTLLDAWGPGNARASSGGETRIMRATYGPDRIYVKMAARALALWRENEALWKRRLFHRTGVLWMAPSDDRYEKAAWPLLVESGLPVEKLGPAELQKHYPQVNFDGVNWAIFEKEAGYLEARHACQTVLEEFVAEGGEYRELRVKPGAIERGEMRAVSLSDGTDLRAEQFVFACGPWLGEVFPDILGDLIKPTRQEVFFFGAPGEDRRFVEESLPVWIDHGESQFYGIPGNQGRGFKLASDKRGPPFDPTSDERVPTPEGIQAAREYLRFRFPGMRGAPLLEARVCQYEQSSDGHFIIDRHPRAENVWLLGGGSGHGFKHGPALGEMVSGLVLEGKSPDPFFALARFRKC